MDVAIAQATSHGPGSHGAALLIVGVVLVAFVAIAGLVRLVRTRRQSASQPKRNRESTQ